MSRLVPFFPQDDDDIAFIALEIAVRIKTKPQLTALLKASFNLKKWEGLAALFEVYESIAATT